MRESTSFLIYGAYGYTGRLIARLAVERGLTPALAGRNQSKLADLAEDLSESASEHGRSVDTYAVELDDASGLDRALRDVDVALHCAGPFSRTHRGMAEACLRTRTHYLDISGEIPVYESIAAMDRSAREAGIMLLPGVGFDVVPTDCLAAGLRSRLPSASHLALAIASIGPATVSRGTMKTVLEGLARPGLIRQGGVMRPVPHLSDSRLIDFGNGPVHASRMIVADVFSAFHSTGIPNIETFVALPRVLRYTLKAIRRVGPMFGTRPVQRMVEHLIDLGSPGPSDEDRRNTTTAVWGEVTDDAGNRLSACIRLPESYTFTALSCLAALDRMSTADVPTGYQTPSSAFGAGFVHQIEGVEMVNRPA